ncbi:CD1375 family protein [Paenibacillus oralis]|nr:CD1375 family protein [Paenibacillus oralis]
MAKVYFDLIKKNLKTIDNVPLRWKEQVQELLDAYA